MVQYHQMFINYNIKYISIILLKSLIDINKFKNLLF